jgi:hypothetical protein
MIAKRICRGVSFPGQYDRLIWMEGHETEIAEAAYPGAQKPLRVVVSSGRRYGKLGARVRADIAWAGSHGPTQASHTLISDFNQQIGSIRRWMVNEALSA